MSSAMERVSTSCLSSPLANSTKIYNTHIVCNGANINLSNLYGNTTSINNKYQPINIVSDHKAITTNNTSLTKIDSQNNLSSKNISNTLSSVSNSSNDTRILNTSLRKSINSNKPVVGRKALTSKESVEPIKAIVKNGNNNGMSVEKILKQINMSKYQHAFRKIDVARFKELREIDLNAIGITRPSEIRLFKEAIQKAKFGHNANY